MGRIKPQIGERIVTTRILAVTSEAYPLAKTGGLGDAVSGMTMALREAGMDVTLMLPAYAGTLDHVAGVREIARLADMPGGQARLLSGVCRELDAPVLLLENAALYDREGLYADADGQEYADNAVRFAALAHAAARVAVGRARVAPMDIVHAHDWHAGLTPLVLREMNARTRTIITLHNLAFQGLFPLECAAGLGIPEHYCGRDGIEYWGKLNFLKAGIRYADCVTTVSRNYAREILTPHFGCGLEGLLNARAKDLVPIPNGIDDELWDPARDACLKGDNFHADDLGNKARCKRALQQEFGLPEDPHATLMVLGSRITTQKMADLAIEAIPAALDAHPDLQVAAIGRGDRELEQALQCVAQRYPERCSVHIGFDEAQAHRLHAGADILLHGSRFEPFGLTPLYAMRYGAVPIGSRVGGMVDTIIDPGAQAGENAMRSASGILFSGETAADMRAAIDRAMSLRRRPEIWSAMQRNGMTADFGWRNAAPAYVRLFQSLLPVVVGEPVQQAAPALPARPAHTPAIRPIAAVVAAARMGPAEAARRARQRSKADLSVGEPRPAAA